MITYALETSGLTHRFSKNETVLDTINLQVPHASIFGFLGPNGAGKTTTLRLLLGLLKKQAGSITIFGKEFAQHRVSVLQHTGSLIESPSLYGHLTAVENLSLLQKVYQCKTERIAEVLKLVGLPDTGNKKASQFSLGMKQRLSIAVALLHDPPLLILDEPTNGLDPNGIIEMRELLQKLNRENGTTIIISSHLLAEIERLVSHIGIINKGKLMFQGTLAELKQKQDQGVSIIFETNETEKTIRILTDKGLLPLINNGQVLLPAVSKETIAELNRLLVDNGVDIYGIHKSSNDLETIFMDLIKN